MPSLPERLAHRQRDEGESARERSGALPPMSAGNVHSRPSPSPRSLYHVAARPIPTGQVLRPYALGRDQAAVLRLAARAVGEGPEGLGRLLTRPEWGHLREEGGQRAEMVLLEAIFERARGSVAPSSPSRLGAVFAWASLALAERYRAEYRPGAVIHRCVLEAGTVEERDAALLVEAFETTDLGNPRPRGLRRAEGLAVRYWTAAEPMELPELLGSARVRVEGLVAAEGDADRPADTP